MNTMKVLFNVIIITFTHLVAVKHLLLFLICIMEFEYVFSQVQNTPFSGNYQTKVPNASSCVISIRNEYESIKEKQYKIDYIRNGNTVKYGNGYTDIIVEYNTLGQVVKYEELLYEIKEEYIYDEKGRILEINGNNRSRTHYYYTETNTDSIVSWNYIKSTDSWVKYQKNEIIYNESGYKCVYYNFNNDTGNYDYLFTSEYILDELKRVIEIKELDRSENNRWTYSYTENGYVYTVFQPASTAFCRTEYLYNENGDLTKTIYSEWMNNSYWYPAITTSYNYDYFTGISNLSDSKTDVDISIYSNSIHINNPNNINIILYDMSSKKVAETNKGQTISLPSGMYVIQYSNQTKKIIIK